VNGKTAMRAVVGLLLVTGIAALGERWRNRSGPLLMQGDSVWRMTYRIEFRAPRAGVRLRAAIPADNRHGHVYHQELRYSGLNIERLRPSRTNTRELSVFTQRDGEFRLTARFDIHMSPHTTFRTAPAAGPLKADERARYLRATPTIQADHPTVVKTFQQLQGKGGSQAELVNNLFEYCSMQIRHGDRESPSDAAGVLAEGAATPLGRARALVALCRAGRMPARLVTGFEIKETRECEPSVWAEVLVNSHWAPYDPHNGFGGELPYNFLAARHDGSSIVSAPDASSINVEYSFVPLPVPSGFGRRAQRLSDVLDLTRLPLEMHEVLSILLLMPLGALVTAVFRTLIGMRTFGTFTPTLLALSFVYADWRSGLLVFIVVIALGLAARSLLDRLKLLMVPRLSVILTLVALCLIFGVSLLDWFDWTPSAQAVLLPMVICTMTIERFYVTSEEDGFRFAVQLLLNTVVVGFFCYLVLRWEEVGQLLLAYPEVHFFTVAILIVLGRYTGYRLTELWRFRDFDKPVATETR